MVPNKGASHISCRPRLRVRQVRRVHLCEQGEDSVLFRRAPQKSGSNGHNCADLDLTWPGDDWQRTGSV